MVKVVGWEMTWGWSGRDWGSEKTLGTPALNGEWGGSHSVRLYVTYL